MQTVPGERPVPASLGAFAIAGVLGEGGSGIVYDATWGHRRVALKVLRDALLATERERERFLAEAALLQAIDHPGVVKVLGAGALPDGRPYLAMEHLDGESLAARIARGPLALGDALGLFAQLVSAVAALHERGLVHRDIKPENVIVTSGHAVLLDFGIAKAESSVASTITQEGQVRGTPAYMAPERFFGAPASVATDVYELAVTLYAMLAGRLPWLTTADPTARLAPPRPSELGISSVPAALETALVAALSSRAEARPASARELGARVAAGTLGEAGAPRVTLDLAPAPRPAHVPSDQIAPRPPPKRRARWLAIAGIGAGVAIVGVVAATTGQAPSAPAAVPDPSDPWSHTATRPPSDAANAAAAAIAIDVPVPAAPLAAGLNAQLDLHPADAAALLVLSTAKLRESSALKLAGPSDELHRLTALCGFDPLAAIDELAITAATTDGDVAIDASLRGRFAPGAAERCIAAALGAERDGITRDGDATRIEGAGRTVWVSRPASDVVYVTSRATGDHVGHTQGASVRHGPLAGLLANVDLAATLWMVAQPTGSSAELLPGVAPPRSFYATADVTDAIRMHAGLRFADAASASAATKALQAKLDELLADPAGHAVLGDAAIHTTGRDAVLTAAIPAALAPVTLQGLWKALGSR